jgi:hypothetical protein
MWNFALGRGDIVLTLSIVPGDVIASAVAEFDAGGHKLRDLVTAVFNSPDFIRYQEPAMRLPTFDFARSLAMAAGLAAVAAGCTTTITGDDVPTDEQGLPGESTTSGGSGNTFEHPDQRDPWDILQRLLEDGPPSYSAHVHACMKMKYATLGTVLATRGVSLTATAATSALELRQGGQRTVLDLLDLAPEAPPEVCLGQPPLKAMLGLQAAAATPATNRSYGTVKSASRLLGTNLESQLAVSPADLARYGVTGTTAKKLVDFATTLAITSKAFALGLTSSVILPAFRDDPHGGFNNMNTLVTTVATMGKILDAFYADLMSHDDPTCGGAKIGDNVVFSVHGDTPKTPLQRGGWPDGTPGNSNWTYVFGNGLLKTGWFGGINADGSVTGWDPTTGGTSTMTSAQLAMPAAAAIAYAVARGDMRRVNDFYRGVSIDGVVRPKTM